jgi:hypothetical protein
MLLLVYYDLRCASVNACAFVSSLQVFHRSLRVAQGGCKHTTRRAADVGIRRSLQTLFRNPKAFDSVSLHKPQSGLAEHTELFLVVSLKTFCGGRGL